MGMQNANIIWELVNACTTNFDDFFFELELSSRNLFIIQIAD